MTDRAAEWAETARVLDSAAALLHDQQVPALAQYRDWLWHNELGLAFDELVWIGEAQMLPAAFWEALDRACQRMGITPDDGLYGPAARAIHEHLAAPE